LKIRCFSRVCKGSLASVNIGHPLETECGVDRIRIHLDSPAVAGWNEIDAVGLLDAEGTVHWAVQATASSTYADEVAPPCADPGGASRF
jgi:hypothetical protein